ncbi:MAG TPA: hypothetical protein VN436_17780 [Holophaga sp.]|nr:hypothetical protein [Holophaga sp.]
MTNAASVRVASFLLPMRRLWLQAVLSVQGLMQVLMKERNGGEWTAEDRTQIRQCLKSLAHLAPALALFSLPGGSLLLPLLAWILDRRTGKGREQACRKA